MTVARKPSRANRHAQTVTCKPSRANASRAEKSLARESAAECCRLGERGSVPGAQAGGNTAKQYRQYCRRLRGGHRPALDPRATSRPRSNCATTGGPRSTCYDRSRVMLSGCTFHPMRPARPMKAPSAVGTIATQKSHSFFVSDVSARSEIASAISVSDKSNWSSR